MGVAGWEGGEAVAGLRGARRGDEGGEDNVCTSRLPGCGSCRHKLKLKLKLRLEG